MRKKRFTAVLLSMLLVIGSMTFTYSPIISSASGNLLTNPSFETGDTRGWTDANGAVFISIFSISTSIIDTFKTITCDNKS